MSRSLILLVLALASVDATAYIGPGLGGGVVGVLLGLLGSIGLALIAIFWYPLKRAWKRIFSTNNPRPQTLDSTALQQEGVGPADPEEVSGASDTAQSPPQVERSE